MPAFAPLCCFDIALLLVVQRLLGRLQSRLVMSSALSVVVVAVLLRGWLDLPLWLSGDCLA